MGKITTGPGATRIDMTRGQPLRPTINKFAPATYDAKATTAQQIATGEKERARVAAEVERQQNANLKASGEY
jgi:hypothetical protein